MKLLLLIFCIFCKPKISEPLILNSEESTPVLSLNYGKNIYIENIQPEGEKWNPIIQEKNGEICIVSHPLLYLKNEFGLSSEICGSYIKNYKDIILNSLDNPIEKVSIKVNENIEINNLSMTEILNLWKAEPPSLLITGDRFIEKERYMENIESKNHYTLYGEEKNLNSSFSLAYFTIWYDDKYVYMAYPSEFTGGRKTSNLYLVFSFKKEILKFPEENSVKDLVESKNSDNLNQCKLGSPEITEIFTISGSYSGKFIEIKNNTSEIMCFKEFEIILNKNKYKNVYKIGYLLPGQVILFSEENGKFQSILELALDWKELTDDTVIQLSVNGKDSFFNGKSKNKQRVDEGDISVKNNFKECSGITYFHKQKNLCMDPGIDIKKEFKSCDIGKFSITEINPIGINGELTGKYIEFKYSGEEKCNLSDISYAIDDNRVPFSILEKIIEPNSIFLIGNNKYFENITVLNRDLRSLNLNSKVEIKKDNISIELINLNQIKEEFLIKKSDGLVFSIIYQDGVFKPHFSHESVNIKYAYKQKINGSPGEIIFNTNQYSNKGFISELNIYGSYNSKDSLTGDKFIEIESNGDPYILKIYYSQALQNTIHIPANQKAEKILISRNKLACFPGTNLFLSDIINLNSDITKIELYSNSNLLDEFSKADFEELSYEDRTNRIRKSTTRTSYEKVWKFTNLFSIPREMDPNCFPYTSATPGFSNSYSPFLISSGRTEKNFSFLIHYPLNFPYNSDNIEIYSDFSDKNKILFTYRNTNISEQRESNYGSYDSDQLLYFKWKDSVDLNTLSMSSLVINAVHPNPSITQNEWVIICNRSKNSESILNFEFQDSIYFDKIVPFSYRYPNKNPLNSNKEKFSLNSENLENGECGYLIDPDSSNLILKSLNPLYTPIFTVRDDSTLGNGISQDENVNLYKLKNNTRILVSSYGNQFSHSPFKIKALEGETIILKEGRNGDSINDYRIEK